MRQRMRYRIVLATDTRAITEVQPMSPESKTPDYYAHQTSWDSIFRTILEMKYLHYIKIVFNFPKFHHAVSEDKKGMPLCLVKRSQAVGSHT